MTLSGKSRKALGVFLCAAFLVGYSLGAMAVGGVFLVGKPFVFEVSGFFILGVAWLPVVMGVIRWMAKGDGP